MWFAELLLLFAASYIALGIIFGLYFVSRGMGGLDPVAHDASWFVRLLILPGVTALWPLLLSRWLNSTRGRKQV